jgi:6-phosphogluconate dehydrogenase
MVGLGVMGRNLVLNMADHGFSVAGYAKGAFHTEWESEAES